MKHREAINYLAEFRRGALEPPMAGSVRLHVASCTECREWLTAYDFLSAELSQSRSSSDDHPDSQLLALFVSRPGELNDADRVALRTHLEHCPDCHNAAATVGSALASARPEEAQSASRKRPDTSSAHWKHAIAAGIAILLVGLGAWITARLVDDRPSPATITATEPGDSPASSNPIAVSGEFSGQELDGVQAIQAERTLTVSRLTLRNGADVSFSAGDRVAFGDGFVVADGARMRVDAGLSKPPIK